MFRFDPELGLARSLRRIDGAPLMHFSGKAAGHHMTVTFSLNGETVSVDAAPTVTLLDWLREEKGLKGTKEGCNEVRGTTRTRVCVQS